MSLCSSAVHVMYYSSGENFSNFTESHPAIRSCVLLLQPFIAVCLFTSDVFDSWYSAACLLHTKYSPRNDLASITIDIWLTVWGEYRGLYSHQKLLTQGCLRLLRTNLKNNLAGGYIANLITVLVIKMLLNGCKWVCFLQYCGCNPKNVGYTLISDRLGTTEEIVTSLGE